MLEYGRTTKETRKRNNILKTYNKRSSRAIMSIKAKHLKMEIPVLTGMRVCSHSKKIMTKVMKRT